MADVQHIKGFPPPEWGPWVGAPEAKRHLCAVVGCEAQGLPQVCLADGRYHHHGCIHYDHLGSKAGLTFRKGWGWICETHYQQLKEAQERS